MNHTTQVPPQRLTGSLRCHAEQLATAADLLALTPAQVINVRNGTTSAAQAADLLLRFAHALLGKADDPRKNDEASAAALATAALVLDLPELAQAAVLTQQLAGVLPEPTILCASELSPEITGIPAATLLAYALEHGNLTADVLPPDDPRALLERWHQPSTMPFISVLDEPGYPADEPALDTRLRELRQSELDSHETYISPTAFLLVLPAPALHWREMRAAYTRAYQDALVHVIAAADLSTLERLASGRPDLAPLLPHLQPQLNARRTWLQSRGVVLRVDHGSILGRPEALAVITGLPPHDIHQAPEVLAAAEQHLIAQVGHQLGVEPGQVNLFYRVHNDWEKATTLTVSVCGRPLEVGPLEPYVALAARNGES